MSAEPKSFLPSRILVGAGQHAELIAALRPRLPGAEFRGNVHTAFSSDDLQWADTYVGFKRPPLPDMGSIRWVHCTGAGVDSWLYPRELPQGILLTRTSESFGPMIAEWAISRALTFTQHLFELAELQRRREWRGIDPRFIRGTHAVVVGTGDVGTHIARAFASLGARITGVSRSGRGDQSVYDALTTVDRLKDVVGDADWLVLALPLTRESDRLVDEQTLMACRGAILINAGRGAVVDEAAIPKALESGALGGAALDVFAVEPLPESSPLWNHPRVIVSPHISGPTTIAGAVEGFMACLHALERNEWPTWTVDRARGY